MKNYYIYFHRNPINNEIFYVGVGIGNRCNSLRNRNRFWRNYVNKYGFVSELRITAITKEQALYFEKKYIKHIGRRINKEGTLVNLTMGGYGRLGDPQSEEIKSKISKSVLEAIKKDPTIISRGARKRVGLKRADITKLKMSVNNNAKNN